MSTMFVLLFAYYLIGAETPEKSEIMTFQNKKTCEFVREKIIERTALVIQQFPELAARGTFSISNCETPEEIDARAIR